MRASIGTMTAIVVMLLSPTPHQQPAPAESATAFYLRFRQVALTAKSMDEITAFWCTPLLEDFRKEPEPIRVRALEMIKRTENSLTDVRVLTETATPAGATITLDAVGPDKKPVTGRVDLVKENGAWKLVEAEQWTPKA